MSVGAFHVRSNSDAWFQLDTNLNPNALPVAYIENISTGSFDVEIESSPDKDDANLTSEMTPVTVIPGGKIRIDLPKVPATHHPNNYSWQKVIITNAQVDGLVAKINVEGPATMLGYPDFQNEEVD